ncbi:heavy-metal-associated domain-containing protein [Kineosporia rhizophila]|uniref:heavy-metal-associated domain-containing protein n=1 Tax=Kineosporia rhizophila TaxID=84633 RepID=UPI000A8D5F5D|nr:heavy metal-associated domain-containing protein [Kineosporia rhizophila]MCE0536091.1 heavy-metal-associated domain-containing protein [Kineosporia rhizophila]
MTAIEYKVTGMTCGHCETAVAQEVGRISDLDGVEVSAQTGRLVLTASGGVDNAAVLAAVDEAGYTAELVS